MMNFFMITLLQNIMSSMAVKLFWKSANIWHAM